MESDNLCKLKILDEASLIEALKERYLNSCIYTNSGLFLISINPYEETNLYSNEVAELYRKRGDGLQPHVYDILEQCRIDKDIYGEHTIIINGDSGSGKTECTKYMLKYLGVPVLTDAEEILESFGNCKTLLNDNSSRFGKLIRLNETLSIETFLLERSRVTGHVSGEGNFHIFYYILAKNRHPLENDYIYFKEPLDSQIESYNNVLMAFLKFDIDFKEIEEIVLGIIYLGSIKIEQGVIHKSEKYFTALQLLSLNESAFDDFLLKKQIKVNHEEIITSLSDAESYLQRNSLARMLYENVFQYVLLMINKKLSKIQVSTEKLNILDIFGFENFENNGLNQFCINWCNERIHNHFVRDTFEYEKNILASEGLDFQGGADIGSILKNCNIKSTALEKIEKPIGIVDLILEESIINGSALNLGYKLNKYLGLKVSPANKVSIDHFNGKVFYSLSDFFEKSKEKCAIDKAFVSIFKEGVNEKEYFKYLFSVATTSKNTVGSFRNSLNNLFNIIEKTRVKYVKCIKPNTTKAAFVFDKEVVLKQLKCCGIFESVVLSRYLFPHAMKCASFKARYPFSDLKEKYLTIGKTRVFFNNDALLELEKRRNEYVKELDEHIKMFFKAIVHKHVLIQLQKPMNEDIIDIKEDTSKTLEVFKVNENKCLRLVEQIEEQTLSDLRNVGNQVIERKEEIDANQLKEENMQLKKMITDLENELKLIKHMKAASKMINGQIFSAKYKNAEKSMSESFEGELERLKQKFQDLQFSNESNSDEITLYSIFKSLIELFLDNIPAYSEQQYMKNEILCFAQCVYYTICSSFKKHPANTFKVFLEELNKQMPNFQESLPSALYIISNLIELRVLFKDRLSGQIAFPSTGIETQIGDNVDNSTIEIEFMRDIVNELDVSIKTILLHFSDLVAETISEVLPHAILDFEPLKHLNSKSKIMKNLFGGPTISRLVQYLEYFHEICNYFYLDPSISIDIMTFSLSVIDQVTFNSLLMKKKFLNFDKCYEINYNLSEIEKFCFNIGFRDGFFKMKHVKEALKVATMISRLELIPSAERRGKVFEDEYKLVRESVGKSSLSHSQINTIVSKFESVLFEPLQYDGDERKFIIKPQIGFPDLDLFTSDTCFIEPSYLPPTSLLKVLKFFYDV
ncbi:Myosin type-2 heavy chain 1 [Glugoides intestinalis]